MSMRKAIRHSSANLLTPYLGGFSGKAPNLNHLPPTGLPKFMGILYGAVQCGTFSALFELPYSWEEINIYCPPSLLEVGKRCMEIMTMSKVDAKSCTQTAPGILRERRRTPGWGPSVSGCLRPPYILETATISGQSVNKTKDDVIRPGHERSSKNCVFEDGGASDIAECVFIPLSCAEPLDRDLQARPKVMGREGASNGVQGCVRFSLVPVPFSSPSRQGRHNEWL